MIGWTVLQIMDYLISVFSFPLHRAWDKRNQSHGMAKSVYNKRIVDQKIEIRKKQDDIFTGGFM